MRVAWRQLLASSIALRGACAVAAGLIAVGGAWIHATLVDPVYEAAARLRIEASDGTPAPDALARHHRDLALSPAVLARLAAPGQGAAIEALRARLSVTTQGGASVTIAARAPAGPEATALANAAVTAFVAQYAPQIGPDPVETLRRRRDLAEERLAAARDRPRGDDAGDRLGPLARALAEATGRAEEAARRVEALEREAGLSSDALALSRGLSEPALDGVRLRYRESAKALEELGVTLGPRHPALLEADQRRRAAERLLRMEVRRVVQAANEDLATSRAAERRARDALERARAIAPAPGGDLPPDLPRLEREAATARAAYEAALAQGGASPGLTARIASAAEPPRRPLGPGAPLLAVAGSSGLLAGWAASSALTRRRRPAAIAGEGATPASSARPEGGAPRGSLPWCADPFDPDSDYARRVDAIADEALERLDAHDAPLVAVTSARPGTGVSTLAAALSAALSRRERRVLLVDPTSDAGPTRSLLGVALDRGHLPEPTFHAVELGGESFRVLPLARLVAPGGSPALQAGLLTTVLRLVRTHFDLVVLDAPPLPSRGPLPVLVAASDLLVVVDQDANAGAFASYRLASPDTVLAAA